MGGHSKKKVATTTTTNMGNPRIVMYGMFCLYILGALLMALRFEMMQNHHQSPASIHQQHQAVTNHVPPPIHNLRAETSAKIKVAHD